jgi:hypothetical protein
MTTYACGCVVREVSYSAPAVIVGDEAWGHAGRAVAWIVAIEPHVGSWRQACMCGIWDEAGVVMGGTRQICSQGRAGRAG